MEAKLDHGCKMALYLRKTGNLPKFNKWLRNGCPEIVPPQSGDDAKAEALEDVAYIRKTLGKTWINQMQRERVEEIHARLNKVEAALSAPVKPEKVEGLDEAINFQWRYVRESVSKWNWEDKGEGVAGGLPIRIIEKLREAARLYATRPTQADIAEVRDCVSSMITMLRDNYEYSGDEDEYSETLKMIASGEKALEKLQAWWK